MVVQRKKSGKGKRQNVVISPRGRAYIKASFNNVIVTITNHMGDVVSWSSSGKMGFRGSKKSTPYAGQVSAGQCARTAQEKGVRQVEVFVKGPGAGRESAIRSLVNEGLEVLAIRDVTPLPHNGCRPPKRRRV